MDFKWKDYENDSLMPVVGGLSLIFPKDRTDKAAAQKLLELIDGAIEVVDWTIDKTYYGVLVDMEGE